MWPTFPWNNRERSSDGICETAMAYAHAPWSPEVTELFVAIVKACQGPLWTTGPGHQLFEFQAHRLTEAAAWPMFQCAQKSQGFLAIHLTGWISAMATSPTLGSAPPGSARKVTQLSNSTNRRVFGKCPCGIQPQSSWSHCCRSASPTKTTAYSYQGWPPKKPSTAIWWTKAISESCASRGAQEGTNGWCNVWWTCCTCLINSPWSMVQP